VVHEWELAQNFIWLAADQARWRGQVGAKAAEVGKGPGWIFRGRDGAVLRVRRRAESWMIRYGSVEAMYYSRGYRALNLASRSAF
jgi:hypothetical protein